MEISTKLFVCFLIAIGIQSSDACNGYGIKIKKIENRAGDRQVIKVDPNSTVSVNENCELSVNICVETIGFKTCKMDLTFFKNNAKVYEVSDMNVCTMLKKSGNELGQITRALGMPDLKCPMPKFRHCIERTMNISKMKSYLPAVAGDMEIRVKMKHNNGNTDMRFAFEIVKK